MATRTNRKNSSNIFKSKKGVKKGHMKPILKKTGFVLEIIFGILFIIIGIGVFFLFPLVQEDILCLFTLPDAFGLLGIVCGILALSLGMINLKSYNRKRILVTRKSKPSVIGLFIILGGLEIIGFLVADMGGNEMINNYYYWDFHLQPVLAALFLFLFVGTSIILTAIPLVLMLKLAARIKKNKAMRLVKPLRTSATAISLIAIIFGAGTGINLLISSPPCYYSTIGFQEPAYALPSGSHHNTGLDGLNSTDQDFLAALEKGLWAMTRVRQGGGFPMFVEPDGSKYYGDRGEDCPYGPGEFSMQSSTPHIAEVFLKMYQLEPNPVYLQVARDAADALLKVQDSENGGFYYDGIVKADGTAMQPHPANIRRAALLDDNVMQSCLNFLIDIYAKTNDTRYLAAIQKGFNCIDSMATPIGGWRQRSNYALDAYPSLVTLNDGALRDTFYLYLKAYDYFNDTRYLDEATKAAQFLLDVQGNGGSPLQQGWAQQYTWEGMPEWGRHFEPPGMCSATTSQAIWVLIEMFLRTNDSTWIDTIPDAIAWLEDPSTEVAGTYSRLYELVTNRPIYGIKLGGGEGRHPEYTYDINEAGEGYGWQGDFGVTGAIYWYNHLNETLNFNITEARQHLESPPSNATLSARAQAAGNSQTIDGFWLDGSGDIRDSAFWTNAGNLIAYLDRQVNG